MLTQGTGTGKFQDPQLTWSLRGGIKSETILFWEKAMKRIFLNAVYSDIVIYLSVGPPLEPDA